MSLSCYGQASDSTADFSQGTDELNPPINQTTNQLMAFPNTYESGSPTLGTNPFYTPGQNDISQVATRSELNGAFLQGTNLSGINTTPLMTESESPIKPIRLGPFMLKTAISANAVNDDNILAQSTNRQSDTIITTTPAFRLEYGELDGQKATASLTYAPSIIRFLNNGSQNTTDQFVDFSLSYPFNEWTFFLTQDYSLTTGTDIDVHNRVTQESFDTTIGANYQVDEKLSVNTSFSQVISDFVDGGAVSTDSWVLDTSANFRATEKLTVGPEVLFGFDNPQGDDGQEYVQIMESLTYQPTVKITLYSQGGVEVRQFNQGGGADINPIFRTGISYSPFESGCTTLDLAGFQTVRTSTLSSDQNVIDLGVGLTFRQRFFQRVYLTLNASYSHADYQTDGNSSSTPSSSPSNEDDLVLRSSLSVNPTEWSSLNLYYQYQDTTSSQANNSFQDHQAGVSVTVQL